ncbi:hypothetical protein EHEL_101840 [Encephalitozoon hellem ATCC 50504]|uniref:Uncharacterized protein n=1 Tax=Encephalitozoon hellem TaxID=27973 RepID=A0A9Q9C3H2_ENCHE|nr:uncharacterized protein EHEL_101840 [Encephalitozoon hellem ATCC 50504]AFM99276.1 hypothetical protein EHEL_101840 [Encephalitozoon hellem ATCC 50504]UTX43469.1 hypothetical protein GPU96_07g12260 [Encephalitozoon hellem]UTX44264.1 hypothetical protein GPU96_10g20560 [Encephalitozoon hellem]|eukprot:XP_003888257.1 hypothetical protein EHEL_101840 [Encephalitozoon hellem ATCC 50504]
MRAKRRIVVLVLVLSALFIFSAAVIINKKSLRKDARGCRGTALLSKDVGKACGMGLDGRAAREGESSFSDPESVPKEDGATCRIYNSFMLVVGEENGGTEKEDSCSPPCDTEAIENKLFKRSPRLISFEVKDRDSMGEYLFGLLRKTIDGICSYSSSGGKEQGMPEITSSHIGLINHYMGYLRKLIYKLGVMYSDDFELESIYTPYSDAIDCFTGIKLTRYHTAGALTKNEGRYMSYIERFVDKEAEDIPIRVEGGRSCLNMKDHIMYVLLHYICLFSLKSQDTIDMLYTKLSMEKVGKSNVDPLKVVNKYRYKDILESVRPIHFVNADGYIVKPLIKR